MIRQALVLAGVALATLALGNLVLQYARLSLQLARMVLL